jgi:hypothetical protein
MNTTHTAPLRCDGCGQVIGVYEPVTVVDDGLTRQTSVAAEPSIRVLPVERYHQACLGVGPSRRASARMHGDRGRSRA